MASVDSEPEDAITKAEIAGEASAPAASASGISKKTVQRNAFTELMKPKPKAPQQPIQSISSNASASARAFRDRDGLGVYTHDPSSFPASRVLYFDDDFVVINDMYPKSTVHALLLPRSPRKRLHPFEAFDDAAFLASVQAAALKLRALVAKELQRRLGRYSAADQLREAVLDGDADWEGDELPRGRDWEHEVMVGIHAHPSMNDLHVHVMSRDMFSECMKHRKHYNSFNTPFLIDLTDFPLSQTDARRQPGRAGFLEQDLVCWRCGENFGNKFRQLKAHLNSEFEEWKRE